MSKYKDVLISNPSILSIITQNVIFVNEIIIKKKTIYIFFLNLWFKKSLNIIGIKTLNLI